MRFTYAESMIDPHMFAPLAKAAEDAGFHSMVIPDSIAYPRHSDSVYPYTPDGSREFLEDKPFIEPFSLIPFLAAATERIRFVTFVLKLPIRHPVLVAKQATGVAVLSNNRLSLGVGSSPWPEDYELTEVPWERRGKRMDECIEIINGLATGDYFSYDGEIHKVPEVKICPVPDQPIPMLIGGTSGPALRRAARLGDGWLHAGDEAELDEQITELHAELERQGRNTEDFEIHVISMHAYSPDGIKALEARGVTDVIVGFRDPYTTAHDTESLETKIAAINSYAESVISASR